MDGHSRRSRAGPGGSTVTRRRFLGSAAAGAAIAPLALQDTAAAQDEETVSRSVVRLATIPGLDTGGLLTQLLAGFEQRTGHRVEVFTSRPTHGADGTSPVADLFERARAGLADIVMTHWGVAELAEFVDEGLVRWPMMIAANSTGTFIVPPSDPAGVRGVTDPVAAFGRIAQTRSPFVVNDTSVIRYVLDVLWNGAGRPDKQGWYLDLGLIGRPAMVEAARRGGYSMWGLHPFLMSQQQQPLPLQAVVFQDSLLQRVMSATVVRPGPYRRVHVKGAFALERYLVDPATQARIHTFRLPGFNHPIIWPAGHHNHIP
jgi:tungstate transport system substrate-binding protein